MHADEVDIDIALVRRLLAAQFPHWADRPISPVASSGTDNAMFRLGNDLAVRLPRVRRASADIETEQRWLPVLAPRLPVAIPEIVEVGEPTEDLPWHWSVNRWLTGRNPQIDALAEPEDLAIDLAEFITALRAIDPTGAPRLSRSGPLTDRDEPTTAAITASEGLVDTAALHRIWAETLAIDTPPEPIPMPDDADDSARQASLADAARPIPASASVADAVRPAPLVVSASSTPGPGSAGDSAQPAPLVVSASSTPGPGSAGDSARSASLTASARSIAVPGSAPPVSARSGSAHPTSGPASAHPASAHPTSVPASAHPASAPVVSATGLARPAPVPGSAAGSARSAWAHGDLSPGNVLIDQGRLRAVIDFGGFGVGDPTVDLVVAWNLLPAAARPILRAALDVDDATWARGRGWALSIAAIQLPYYLHTNPALAANARHVLDAIVADQRLG